MRDELQKIVQEIYNRYDEQKATKAVSQILARIKQGGRYKDIYEYIRVLGFGDILKRYIEVDNWLDNRGDFEELVTAFVETAKYYSQDINDLAEIVQKSINDSLGINLKPQRIKVDVKALQNNILEIIQSENYDLLHNEFITFGVNLTDAIIQANATLQAESGFDIVIVRRYDDVGIHNYANYSDKRTKAHGPEVCQFCKEREGTWEYEQTKTDKRVYQRHPGCSCSIDYVNKGFSERVQNYRG